MTHPSFTTTGANHWTRPHRMPVAVRESTFGRVRAMVDERPEGEIHPVKGTLILAAMIAVGALFFVAIGG